MKTKKKAKFFFALARYFPKIQVATTDYENTSLLSPKNVCGLRNAFDEKHPECKGKKLILYAPTFRDSDEANKNLGKIVADYLREQI